MHTQSVSGDTVILLIGGSRLLPYRTLFPWIRIGLYIVRKIRFNSMNHVGHVLYDYFNRTNPQWRRRCKIIITQKNTCLTSGSKNITKFFPQVMCELKIAQLKHANTLSTKPSIGGEVRVCTIAKWWSRVLRAFRVTPLFISPWYCVFNWLQVFKK